MAQASVSAKRIVEFLNTRGVGFSKGQDQLDSVPGALGLYRSFGQGKAVNESSLTSLRELRDLLLMLQQAPKSTKLYARLEAFAAGVAFRPQIKALDHAEWTQTAGDPMIGGVISDLFEVLNNDQWKRIKTCTNEACNATFYDESRSGTQRWHSYATCGNRSNVAAFRSRQAE